MLYRYFHPHLNPRLRLVPLRLQELGEMEQAAIELKKAIQRAKIRTEYAPIGSISKEDLSNLLDAMNYVAGYLGYLFEAHPGDSEETLRQLLEERHNLPGWENWVKLVSERMSFLPKEEEEQLEDKKSATAA